MEYYHGTDVDSAKSICEKISLEKSSEYLDFGPGFYITNSRKSAEKWALKKAGMRKKKPAIVIVEFDIEKAEPYIVEFENDLRWGQFIINNRSGYDYIDMVNSKEHNLDCKYDITYGRIADYSIHNVVTELVSTGKELKSVDCILNVFFHYQYAFHTKKALTFVTCKKYEVVKEAQNG